MALELCNLLLHGVGVRISRALPEDEGAQVLSCRPGGIQPPLGHLPGQGGSRSGNALGHNLTVCELGLIGDGQAKLLQIPFCLGNLLLPGPGGVTAETHRHLFSKGHFLPLSFGGEHQIIGGRNHCLLTHHKAFDGNSIGGCIEHCLGRGNATGGRANDIVYDIAGDHQGQHQHNGPHKLLALFHGRTSFLWSVP